MPDGDRTFQEALALDDEYDSFQSRKLQRIQQRLLEDQISNMQAVVVEAILFAVSNKAFRDGLTNDERQDLDTLATQIEQKVDIPELPSVYSYRNIQPSP